MSAPDRDPQTLLGRPLTLPCGARLKNRLIKAAMSDGLGDGAGNPTPAQSRLYERWALGGAALSLIGEVQTTPGYPEQPGNLVLQPGQDLPALRNLAAQGAVNGAHIWPQLGHAGALSCASISQPKGPSALNIAGLQCQGMTRPEIEALPARYAQAAALAQKTGFTGVQLHAGHGFLFSQFLSPLFNHRTDAYGGAVSCRFRIVGETIQAVRQAVGPGFPIGIKINATDKLIGGLSEAEALEVVGLLSKTSVDLIDVSGGTYFPGAPASSEGMSASGPYFRDFAKRAKAVTTIPVMLTGGVKTRDQAVDVVATGAADTIGLARSMVLDPALAARWLGDAGRDPVFPAFEAPPPGGITAWYTMRLAALGHDAEQGFTQGLTEALASYDARNSELSHAWRARFGSPDPAEIV